MAESFEFVVSSEDAGRRLDYFLASRFAALSRMRIANLINEGACLVNGLRVNPGHRIIEGDTIILAFEEGPPTAMQPERLPLEIACEDEHIIVVIKPAGMLVHPTLSVKSGTLANALAYHLNKEFYDSRKSEVGSQKSEVRSPKSENQKAEGRASPGSDAERTLDISETEARGTEAGHRTSDIGLLTPAHGEAHSLIRPGLVHRLDRATSGLMVVAKTQRALSRLTIHFRRRLVEKRYVALVRGLLAEDEIAIVAPIGRDSERQPQWWVDEAGKPAETRLRVIERLDEATLVEMEPVTGRTNQLRIHSAYIGHPIVGDNLYGAGGRSQESGGGEDDCAQAADGSGRVIAEGETSKVNPCPLTPDPRPLRLCLHASRLAFHHPASNEWMGFTAPLPTDFQALLDEMRNSRKSEVRSPKSASVDLVGDL